ncbi:MAG: hypothetical protein GY851_34555, partial [bacterium]|nr:hypothetical protein [bacterium]
MEWKAILAVVIAGGTFIGILSEKVNKTVAAMLGGTAMVILSVVSEEKAFEAIDLGVIF